VLIGEIANAVQVTNTSLLVKPLLVAIEKVAAV
jgi:hypothetical protein